mgnify:CR=1 FL=1
MTGSASGACWRLEVAKLVCECSVPFAQRESGRFVDLSAFDVTLSVTSSDLDHLIDPLVD